MVKEIDIGELLKQIEKAFMDIYDLKRLYMSVNEVMIGLRAYKIEVEHRMFFITLYKYDDVEKAKLFKQFREKILHVDELNNTSVNSIVHAISNYYIKTSISNNIDKLLERKITDVASGVYGGYMHTLREICGKLSKMR